MMSFELVYADSIRLNMFKYFWSILIVYGWHCYSFYPRTYVHTLQLYIVLIQSHHDVVNIMYVCVHVCLKCSKSISDSVVDGFYRVTEFNEIYRLIFCIHKRISAHMNHSFQHMKISSIHTDFLKITYDQAN